MLSPNQKEISRGKNGIVYYKALNCKDNTQPKGDYVSKLMTRKKAIEEYSHSDKIRATIPTGAVYSEYMCDSSYVRGNKDTLIFSKFGGYPLVAYWTYLDEYTKDTEIKFEPSYWNKVMKGLYILKDEIVEMNNKGLYHNDINLENILYNQDTGKMLLIDFAEATNTPPERKYRNGSPLTDVTTIDSIIDDFISFKERAKKVDAVAGGRRKRKTRKNR